VPLTVIHHAEYVAASSAESRYRWNKNGLVRDLLRERGDSIRWIEPTPMPRRWIEAVHDPVYVAEVLEARVPKEKERRIGFPVTETVALRAVRVPGGTWAAALAAIRHGFAVNIAGGSHHAQYDTGAGYCVFNDLAITAVRLVAEQLAPRVLIVDCDVHQGDGTAWLTADHPAIATYSIHA
jgi:acetoin utilization deacetylase AcuC-like enzyme